MLIRPTNFYTIVRLTHCYLSHAKHYPLDYILTLPTKVNKRPSMQNLRFHFKAYQGIIHSVRIQDFLKN